jgi:2,3-dihydroxy-2,3-dihydro-p-cumate dehydrogenase
VNRLLEARVAIVTGAARGIGRAIARRFVAEGARVVLNDVDGEAGAATTQALEAGDRVTFLAGDLAQIGEAERLVAAALDRFGRLDVLVNNAGGGVIRPFLAHTEETIRATIDRNLMTTIRCCRAALPPMIERRYGRIVNIGAESVRNGLWMHAMYNAAKGGVHALTTGLAREFADRGIRVNTVAPSAVSTEAVQEMLSDREALPGEWRDFWDKTLASIPLGRPAEMDEVADVVTFVASDRSEFVTGQVISVNGGSSML